MATSATYRRRLLGGRSASFCSEAQRSSSFTPGAPVIPTASAAAKSSRGSTVSAAEEGNPVAILDRLSYILTLADKPESALSVLKQILELVASPMARLCLRARGAFPRLLEAIHLVVERSPSGECRLMQASILWQLSLDNAVRVELLDAALTDLLETLRLGIQSPLLPMPGRSESPTPELTMESGLLKRRRCLQQKPCLRRGRRLEVSAATPESLAVALVLKHLQAALTEAEYHGHVLEPCADGVLLPLLVLRQCLRGQGNDPRVHHNSISASQSVLQAVLPMVLAEVPLWQLQHDGMNSDPNLWTSHPDGLRLLLLLDVLEACVGCGASERTPSFSRLPCLATAGGDDSSCLAHLCWWTLCSSLDRSDNIAPESPNHLGEITKMCLRLVFSLTQRHSFWAQLILQPLPWSKIEKAGSAVWRTRVPSVLAVLVEALGTDMAADNFSGSSGQGIISRLALGILANVASQGMIERQTVAKHRVSADYPQRLLCSALALGNPTFKGVRIHQKECSASDKVTSLTFLEALALAFHVRCKALSSVGEDGRPMLLPEVKGDTEVCVTCAVSALLIGWLMHEDPDAHAAVRASVGPTEFLVDLLRPSVVCSAS